MVRDNSFPFALRTKKSLVLGVFERMHFILQRHAGPMNFLRIKAARGGMEKNHFHLNSR
ncbi:hypothetical protein CSB95_6166 [Pseudomonas aeruginosa]|nr:hypothetical protein CSC29_6814 [Pseudomonas aeruginosa]PRW19683.1 hypothetical protein CSB95_6166 [Pseudomonas aeruginosa]